MTGFRHGVRTVLAFGALIGVLGTAANAADESGWIGDKRSAARLIAGAAPTGGNASRAGLQIRLAPGWHTYWRYPGDSGVPPHFDFSGSQNLASAKALFPAPRLFSDESGQSIGYTDAVTFPLHVTPKEAGKPVVLHVKVDYAVCEKLCVPVEAQIELSLTGAAGPHDKTLAAAEARVPKLVPAAQLGLSVRRVGDGKKPLVAVDLKPPADGPLDIFVEGPTPDWALPVPKPVQGAPTGHRHFSFALDGLPPGADPKSPVNLTFTVVQGDTALVTTAPLD